MALGQRLEIRQGQSLVMTPQLQQAIKLLQLSNIELAEYCEQSWRRNPLLERDESRAARSRARNASSAKAPSERADESRWRARISPRSPTWTSPRTRICMTATRRARGAARRASR